LSVFRFSLLYSKNYSWSKYVKKSVLLSECSFSALAETALWLLPEGLACAVGAKANVPFAGRHKIELKKMCGGENKKIQKGGQ